MVFWVEKLSTHSVSARSGHPLLFLILNLSMRVIEVDWNDLLRDWGSEGACYLSSFVFGELEA